MEITATTNQEMAPSTIDDLPDFILEEVFEQFEKYKLLSLSSVCSRWRRLIVPLYWRSFEGNIMYQLLKRPHVSLLKERGGLLRHLDVALNFSTWEFSSWEITLTYCPYLVSGSFEVRTSYELKKLFLAASTLLPHLTKLSLYIKFNLVSWPVDPLILLDSLEELYIDFAYHLENIDRGFFLPLKGSRLKRLSLTVGNKADLGLILEIQNSFPYLTHFSISGSFYSNLKDGLPYFAFKHLRSLKVYATKFMFEFNPSSFFGPPSSLPNLICLEMDSGRRSLKPVQHYVLSSFWPGIKTIACDVGYRISRGQLYNMRNITCLSLRFASKKDSTRSIPKVLSHLSLLTHVAFKGDIIDSAFKQAILPSNQIREIKLDGIHSLKNRFISWLVSLKYLQKLTLIRIYDEPPFFLFPEQLPKDARFLYLLYAQFPVDNHCFSRWLQECSPDLTDFTELSAYD